MVAKKPNVQHDFKCYYNRCISSHTAWLCMRWWAEKVTRWENGYDIQSVMRISFNILHMAWLNQAILPLSLSYRYTGKFHVQVIWFCVELHRIAWEFLKSRRKWLWFDKAYWKREKDHRKLIAQNFHSFCSPKVIMWYVCAICTICLCHQWW